MKAITSDRILPTRIFHLASGKTIGRGASIKDFPIPSITDTEILVKVTAVALNPIDHKYIDLISPKNSRVGCDYAGVITQVGSDAKGNWNIGDRVAGMVHGGPYPDQGSFAEYVRTEGDLAWRIPEGMEDGVATTYGISASTAMLALNMHLGVPWLDEQHISPVAKKETILIYSAASTVGLFAIQIAKAAGWQVVTTASPRSTELVKSYGADFVFDYHSPTAAGEIANQFPDLTKALDCYSVGTSSEFCARAMKSNSGTVIALVDTSKKSKKSSVLFKQINIYTTFGEEFAWLPPVGPKFPVNLEDRKALARFCGILPDVLGMLKAPPVEAVQGGGFEGIFKGLDELRSGKVVGKKLVVNMA